MISKYEKLLDEAAREKITVDEAVPFKSNLKGLYVDNNIALSDTLETSAEKLCVLGEELGHHFTSVGNILDPSDPANAKQEHQARYWACEKLVGLHGIIQAFLHGCQNYHDAAEYLDVTEQQVRDAVENYRKKFGIHVEYEGYDITFEPYLIIGLCSDSL